MTTDIKKEETESKPSTRSQSQRDREANFSNSEKEILFKYMNSRQYGPVLKAKIGENVTKKEKDAVILIIQRNLKAECGAHRTFEQIRKKIKTLRFKATTMARRRSNLNNTNSPIPALLQPFLDESQRPLPVETENTPSPILNTDSSLASPVAVYAGDLLSSSDQTEIFASVGTDSALGIEVNGSAYSLARNGATQPISEDIPALTNGFSPQGPTPIGATPNNGAIAAEKPSKKSNKSIADTLLEEKLELRRLKKRSLQLDIYKKCLEIKAMNPDFDPANIDFSNIPTPVIPQAHVSTVWSIK